MAWRCRQRVAGEREESVSGGTLYFHRLLAAGRLRCRPRKTAQRESIRDRSRDRHHASSLFFGVSLAYFTTKARKMPAKNPILSKTSKRLVVSRAFPSVRNDNHV